MRQRDAALAADLARLSERRRAIGDEAVRLEADRTRLRDLDEQLERDLGDAQLALEDARSASARLEAERAGLVDQQAQAASRREQAATAEAATAQTLEMAETELRQALAVQAELEPRARQFRERLVGSADTRRALAEAEQETERELAALTESMPPEHATPTGEPVDATVRAAEAAVHAAEMAGSGRARARRSPG